MECISNKSNIPAHIGIIMGGNRRWAISNQLNDHEGYKIGKKVLKDISLACSEIGVQYLTVSSYLGEEAELTSVGLEAILNLLNLTQNEENALLENNIRIKFIGAVSKFSKNVVDRFKHIEDKTANCKGLTLTIACAYGGKEELLTAFNTILGEIKTNQFQHIDVTEEVIEAYLYSKDLPDPEVVIRSGGEERTSGFLLWKAAYSELIFMEKYWPDFTIDDLMFCLKEYQNREINRGQ